MSRKNCGFLLNLPNTALSHAVELHVDTVKSSQMDHDDQWKCIRNTVGECSSNGYKAFQVNQSDSINNEMHYQNDGDSNSNAYDWLIPYVTSDDLILL